MKDDHVKHADVESLGGPMIRLKFREFILAPEFAHLMDAPMGEAETCETLWPAPLARTQTCDSANGSPQKWTLNAVTTLLEKHRQRATYAAVSGVIGRSPQGIMSTRPKIPRNSWVVSKKSGLPTGYRSAQMHSDLKTRARIISNAEELLDWLQNPT